MNFLVTNHEHTRIKSIRHEKSCPYNGITVCMASLSSMAIDTKGMTCCTSEDFDNCPIFLSKVLRRS
jgi:hypothetical protein